MRWIQSGTVILLTTVATGAASAQTAGDVDGVRGAALDYIEGFYTGDADRLRRSVAPEVEKYGYYIPRDGSEYAGEAMSFEEMLEYADDVRETRRFPDSDAPKEVEVLHVMDQIAAARVVAWWGTDYLHLARRDGRWMIVHVLWQTPTPGSA